MKEMSYAHGAAIPAEVGHGTQSTTTRTPTSRQTGKSWAPDRAAYATDHLFVILDDRQSAQNGVNALLADGVATDDVHMYAGAVDAHRLEAEEKRSLITRAFRALQELVTYDAHTTRKHFPQALHQGKAVIMVACPTDAAVQRAADLLARVGAYHMVYYGGWTIQLVSPERTVTTGEPR